MSRKTENSKKKQEWQPANVEESQEIKEHSGQRKKITIYTWIEIKRDIKLEMIQMKEKNSNATII